MNGELACPPGSGIGLAIAHPHVPCARGDIQAEIPGPGRESHLLLMLSQILAELLVSPFFLDRILMKTHICP